LNRLFLREIFRTAKHDGNKEMAAENPRATKLDGLLLEVKENGLLTVCAVSGLA